MGEPAADRRTAARRALARPEFARLWAAARSRLEGNGRSLDGTPLRLEELSATERRAIAGLVGTSAAGAGPLRVRLRTLDETLRSGAVALGLIEWLEATGPLVRDRRREREVARTGREQAWSSVERHPLLQQRPALAGWAAEVRRNGTATRLAGSPPEGAALVVAALDVLDRLPAGNVPLPRLAVAATGDAHALDRDRPLGKLVGAALPVLDDDAPDDGHEHGDGDRTSYGAHRWRRRWALQGVVCDDLSVSVLGLNLPLAPSGDLIADTICQHGALGEPLRLTLRQLAIANLEVVPGATVFVCENPAVPAQAATLLGPASAPIVCVEGQPNTAAHELLDVLAGGGVTFRYHGDFDWDGIRIAAALIDRYQMEPWRFGVEDYEAAVTVARLPVGDPRFPVLTPWSPRLAESMADHALAVHEEQLLDELIADLDRG